MVIPGPDGKLLFPPFGQVGRSIPERFNSRYEYHDFYDLASRDLAIVSKPGGATLLDSLSSATPLVFTDPFGDYEEKNAKLWEHLGFGIPFSEWRDSSFSEECIYRLHLNLLDRQNRIEAYTDGKICGISRR